MRPVEAWPNRTLCVVLRPARIIRYTWHRTETSVPWSSIQIQLNQTCACSAPEFEYHETVAYNLDDDFSNLLPDMFFLNILGFANRLNDIFEYGGYESYGGKIKSKNKKKSRKTKRKTKRKMSKKSLRKRNTKK